MAGIEFLDPDGRGAAEPATLPPPPSQSAQQPQQSQGFQQASPVSQPAAPQPAGRDVALHRTAVLLSAGLWLVAVLAAAFAPFRMLYRVAIGSDFGGQMFQFDGWGRARLAADTGGADPHGARFGIVLYAGIVLLLVAAPLCVRRQLRGRAPGVAGTAVAFAALGVIAGTLGAAWLDAQSVFDGIHANLHLESLDPSSRSLTAVPPQLQLGWFLWFGVLCLGCVLVALALPPIALRLVAGAAARRPLPAATGRHGEDLIGSTATG